jgi:hypothetical protein
MAARRGQCNVVVRSRRRIIQDGRRNHEAPWHGGYYGASGSAYGRYGSAHYGAGYNPSTGTYARGASTSTAYGTQKVGQAYNPYTGAYGATHQTSTDNSQYGSSTFSKNGQTVDTQHYAGANGAMGAAESSNGNRYAASNGNAFHVFGEHAGGSPSGLLGRQVFANSASQFSIRWATY